MLKNEHFHEFILTGPASFRGAKKLVFIKSKASQCATGNLVPVLVDPATFSDPVPVWFRPNTDRIGRI